jgi:hypothetical protein
MYKKMTTRSRTVLTLAAVVMAILALTTTSAKAGLISYVHITNDADCGISTDKTYTHKLDFGTGSPGALINGVQFDAYNNAANGTLNFNREVATGLLSDHAGNANHNVSGGLVDLLTDMYYNGNNEAGGTTTWTLSGLTAGQTYDTRIYTRQWGVSSRTVTMVFDPDGAGPISDSTGVINEDDATTVGFANANDAYYINYQFTAVAGEDLVITLTQDIYNESWHLYGLTNEIAGPITKAYGPTPKDGAQYTDTWVSLSWRPSDYAVSHDVYLGDNFDDVNNATHESETFRGNQPLKSTYAVAGFTGFPYPDGLVPGTTYYWRIDEVNEAEPNSPWKGDVWSFWVPSKKAYQAGPADGAMYIDPDVTLTWTPGLGSKLHIVYFGENFDDVNNAAGGPTQVNTAYTPGHLELGTTYYWRVDESDGLTILKGNVWSFTTLPDVPISDPNLVGWWKLDEGYGATTVDWSGYGNHGAITNIDQGLGENGSVWFDDPERGIVLSFNGNDSTGAFVTAGGVPEMTLTNDFTWAFWARQHEDQATDTAIGGNDLMLGNRYSYTGSDPLEFVKFTPAKFEFYNNDPDYLMTIDYEDIPANVWIHHAGVKKGTTLTYYRNGVESGTSTITKTIQANPFYMAGEPAGGGRWEGWLSDVRLYDKALTLDEIKQVMRGDPLLAWDPNPANGSTPYITEATTLSWSPGDNASQHDIYFGIDRDAVANADTSDSTGIYRGRQNTAVYNPDVEWGGGPYYWRIDEYNIDETISKGKVWSFTVADFIGIDDFEHYNAGDNQIWYSWKDGLGYGTPGTDPYFAGNGTGSAVGDETSASYMEQTIVHGGSKSMPIYYDNNKQGYMKYSEVEYTLTEHRDWTEQGVAELSLWFYGDAANAAEPLYVAVSNNAGAPAVVVHDDANAAQIDTWTEWVIPLSAFADQGIILTNIDKIAIGLGTQGNMTIPDGSGKIYIDDIRLYRPREVAE